MKIDNVFLYFCSSIGSFLRSAYSNYFWMNLQNIAEMCSYSPYFQNDIFLTDTD